MRVLAQLPLFKAEDGDIVCLTSIFDKALDIPDKQCKGCVGSALGSLCDAIVKPCLAKEVAVPVPRLGDTVRIHIHPVPLVQILGKSLVDKVGHNSDHWTAEPRQRCDTAIFTYAKWRAVPSVGVGKVPCCSVKYAYEQGDKHVGFIIVLKKIVDFIIGNKHPNLRLDDNGLLYSDGRERSISWMATLAEGGRPATPRTGYLVEFNALWYNALKFYLSLIKNEPNKDIYRDKAAELAAKIDISFRETFLNQYGYLYDYVDGGYCELSVRPNMVFALSLEYSPLDRKERKGVLDVITRELLTPKGLRTLSPKSYGYRPVYYGHRPEREQAYYQGPARPWLMGAYAEAYLKILGMSGVSFIERMLIGFEEEMSNNCIGTISELFDGNPPYTGRGGISYAVNVAEILRVLDLLKKYNNNI